MMILHVIIPKVEEVPAATDAAAAAAAPAAAAAEPEVIKKGKKEEAEAAEAAPPAAAKKEKKVTSQPGIRDWAIGIGIGPEVDCRTRQSRRAEYSDTRHNLGFQVVEELARRYRVKLRNDAKRKARVAKIGDIGDGVLVAQPTTFMNLSGWAVRDVASFHKVAPPDLLVVVDDADLPLGRLRIRRRGSAGGHNGLKSIIQELGTIEFPRLRIGVGRQAGELKNHVLGRFDAEEEGSSRRGSRKGS